MDKEKVVTIIPDKQIIIDKSDLDFIHKQYKDKITKLEAKITESEKLNKRLQQIVDKLRDKEFAGETLVNAVNAVYEPLYQNKYDEAEQIKQQLKEKDQAIESLQEINQSLGQTCNNDAKEIEKLREQLTETDKLMQEYLNKCLSLEQQLAEKNELLRQKIGKMKSTDFIRMCVSCGFMVQAKEIDNHTTIAELEKVKEFARKRIKQLNSIEDKTISVIATGLACVWFIDQIDQQIKSLKGDVDGKN